MLFFTIFTHILYMHAFFYCLFDRFYDKIGEINKKNEKPIILILVKKNFGKGIMSGLGNISEIFF
jgi:hypothetical protein